jgi:hypothetical protein
VFFFFVSTVISVVVGPSDWLVSTAVVWMYLFNVYYYLGLWVWHRTGLAASIWAVN